MCYVLSADFVYMYDGDNEIDRQTGTIIPATFLSNYSDIRIVFTSDHSTNFTVSGLKIAIRFFQLQGKYLVI